MSLYSTFVCVLRCQQPPTDVPEARNGESVYIYECRPNLVMTAETIAGFKVQHYCSLLTAP